MLQSPVSLRADMRGWMTILCPNYFGLAGAGAVVQSAAYR